MILDLEVLFAPFLERAVRDGWIKSAQWRWLPEGSNPNRDIERAERLKGSRTHKKAADSTYWILDVEGRGVGVDLERLRPESGADRLAGAVKRLGLPSGTSSEGALEAFSAREAAFKALYPDNEGLLVSDFRSAGPGRLEVRRGEDLLRLEIRTLWCHEWVLTLARRMTEA
jgi:hypothetical protein